MGFSENINSIKNRLKELIDKLDNNKEDLNTLEKEFIELQNVITKLYKKIDKSIPEKDKEEL